MLQRSREDDAQNGVRERLTLYMLGGNVDALLALKESAAGHGAYEQLRLASDRAIVAPSPATHAISRRLKAETNVPLTHAGELLQTLRL